MRAAQGGGVNARHPFPWPQEVADEENIVARASAELAMLHRRRERVPSELLTDQQWAILLELFVAKRAGRTLSTGELTEVAGAPRSTVHRLLDHLAARGLVERDRTGTDGRVTIIRATAAGRAIVAGVFVGAGKDAA